MAAPPNTLIDHDGNEDEVSHPLSSVNVDWFSYYGFCRDSCHNLAHKFLTLLFQFSTFCVASITIVGLLFEKVSIYVALGTSLLSVFGAVYYLVMVRRYFEIVGNVSNLCERVEENILGGPKRAREYGIFHIIALESSFYLSRRIRTVVNFYTTTLLAIMVMVFGSILVAIAFPRLMEDAEDRQDEDVNLIEPRADEGNTIPIEPAS